MEVTAKDKIMEDGRIAYELGECHTRNPYDCYTYGAQYDLWEKGWIDAYENDLNSGGN